MDFCEKGKCPRGVKIVGMVIMGVVGAVVFGLIFGYFVMRLWNWLMPGLFGLSTITFWKAFGIIILARLIFGGGMCGHHGPSHHKMKHHYHRHHGHRGSWDESCCGPKGGRPEEENFDEWWWEEGKGAFERYLETKKSNGNGKVKDPE
jgi:hypothetical protein